MVFEVATRLFVLVGLTSTKLSAWLPVVALTFTTGAEAGQRHEQQIGRYRRTVFGLYAFACTVGHIDALGRRRHLRVQGGCGRREEGENGGKHSQAEACVHMCVLIDAASKSGLKRNSQGDAILERFPNECRALFGARSLLICNVVLARTAIDN